MQLVEKYVRKLLHEHDCVVLPELGGFIVHFNHAFFSTQSSLYHAPQRRVAFNEALKLDDGLLVHYLTLNEQMSREEAQKQLRQFVESVKVSIKEKGEYHLAEMGTLSANAEGKFVFEPQPLVNFHPESYGFASVPAVSVQPTVGLMSDSTADWTYTDRLPEALPFQMAQRRRSRVGWYLGTALLIGALVLGGNIELTSGQFKSSLNPFDLVSQFSGVKNLNTVKKEAERVNNQPVVALSALKQEATLGLSAQPLVLPETPKEVAVVQPEKVIERPKSAVAVAQRLVTESDQNANYWVIACGFLQQENANKLVNKLKRNGYVQAHVFNPDVAEGELIKVAAVGFETKSKANKYLRTVSKLSGARAWVLVK